MGAAILDEMAAGELAPAAFREFLGALPRPIPAEIASDLYSAVLAWTWRALDRRRRDEELRDWYDVIKGLAARLARQVGDTPAGLGAVDVRLRALGDLVAESIAMSDDETPEEIFRRAHVPEILAFLHGHPRPIARAEIGRAMDLGQANLTRILGMMEDGRLVVSKRRGKELLYSPTTIGTALWRRERIKRRSSSRIAIRARYLNFVRGDAKPDLEAIIERVIAKREEAHARVRRGSRHPGYAAARPAAEPTRSTAKVDTTIQSYAIALEAAPAVEFGTNKRGEAFDPRVAVRTEIPGRSVFREAA